MTALTREQRDALAPECFAYPELRKLPIAGTDDDERHVRMAYSQYLQVSGASTESQARAKDAILARADALGISLETRAIVFELEAMAIQLPDVPGHPNRMPFSGVLTRVDEPSDNPPHGSRGPDGKPRRTYIPGKVAERALASLMGMGVDCTPDFSGHDARFKIGVITEATIQGNALQIAGFLYASDFPKECARIRSEKHRLGFSYECKVAVSDQNADPWVIDALVFTGAAILYKADAAYTTTSIAANAAQLEKDIMELKDISAALEKLTASVTSIGQTVEAQSKELKEIKAGRGASLAGPIIDQAMPHVGACNAAADAMEAAGIGTHPTHGHAAVLRRVGASILHGATMGKLPHIFRDHSYLGGDGVEAAAEKEAALKASAEAAAKTEAQLKAVTEQLAALGTQLADLKAAAAKNVQAPERKTITPEVTALLSKLGLNAEADKEKLTVANIDKTLEAGGIKGSAAIAAKLRIQAAGLITA